MFKNWQPFTATNNTINMIRNIINLLILVILFTSCKSEKKCSDYKLGNFTYVNQTLSDWKIFRNDSTQIETSKSTGIEVNGKVTWKSECEYEILYVKTNHPKLQKMIGKKVEVKIINIRNDTITYEATSDTIKLESKMVKVK